MDSCLIYTAGETAALKVAVRHLKGCGFHFAQAPSSSVTHLLLPVPSLEPDGSIKGGGMLDELLKKLPPNVRIIGGNLPDIGYRTYDLLQDADYVAENAFLTAHCALRLVLDLLPFPLRNQAVLVIGWGRIGKCLAALLKSMEASVTVAARKEADRAMLRALGYRASPVDGLCCSGYCVILNTVPAMVLPNCTAKCLKIDLASVQGIGGSNVIWARGLPGKDAPEASGKLIARTLQKYINKEGTS